MARGGNRNLIAILNDGMLMVEDVTLLPFGHSELYLLLGVLVAGWSTKFLVSSIGRRSLSETWLRERHLGTLERP